MALTRIGSVGLATGIDINAGVGTFTGNLTVGGVLTYEDVTNVDSIGLITARAGVKVGSGITLSSDGDIFFTGIMTGNGSGLTGVANTDVIFTDKISLPDSAAGSINVGLGSDLQLYHDSNNSYIDDAGTGSLFLQSGGTGIYFQKKGTSTRFADFNVDGDVKLFHNGSQKLATSASGVTVTGTVAATSYTGDGSALTGISVGIATTAASMTGITTVLDLSKDDFKVTASGITTVDVRGGTEGNNHQIRIVNSGITTVGFSTYFLFPSGGTPNLPTTDGAISFISFTVHRQGAVGLATQLLAGGSVNFS